MTDQEYWDKAAADPNVDEKYIANIDLNESLVALAPIGASIEMLSKATILDLGCGVGRLAIPIAQRFIDWRVLGVDLSQKMLDVAQHRFKPSSMAGEPIRNFATEKTDGHSIPAATGSIDAAYSMLMFQHIDNQNMLDYIYEVSRVLKTHRTFRFQFVQGHHHAPLDHNHDIADVKRWLDNAGFKIKDIETGIIFPQWTWVTAIKEGKS